MNEIRIVIEGPIKSSKTKMMLLMARLMEEQGINVVVQRADPEIDAHSGLTTEELAQDVRAKVGRVVLMEMNTSG